MKTFDKETVKVDSKDFIRWSKAYIKRMEELYSKSELSPSEIDEYRQCITVAGLLTDAEAIMGMTNEMVYDTRDDNN